MLAANRPLRLTIYAVLAAILYLPGLGRPALWEPDEGRYAEIAREMVVSGDYVTPRDDFELYFEKPPLVYWAKAASIQIFGVNEFAVRLPAALFSIGQVVVTAALAEAMLGATAGFFAALVLALSPLFFGFARFATLDPALAFFLTAALAAFYVAAREDSFSQPSARRWMLTSAAMLALGTLAKGPIALLLGGAIALAWLASERRLRQVAQMPLVWCARHLRGDRRALVRADGARNPGFLQFLLHPRASRALRLVERTRMGPVVLHPDRDRRNVALDFLRAARMVRDARRRQLCPRAPRTDRADARPRASSRSGSSSSSCFSRFPAPSSAAISCRRLPPLAIVAGYGLARMPALSRQRVAAAFSPSLRLRTWHSRPHSSYFSNSYSRR